MTWTRQSCSTMRNEEKYRILVLKWHQAAGARILPIERESIDRYIYIYAYICIETAVP